MKENISNETYKIPTHDKNKEARPSAWPDFIVLKAATNFSLTAGHKHLVTRSTIFGRLYQLDLLEQCLQHTFNLLWANMQTTQQTCCYIPS